MAAAVSILMGFLLDLVMGDPYSIPHPVQIIGWFIAKLTKACKWITKGRRTQEFLSGCIMAIFIIVGTYGVCALLLWLAKKIHPVAAFVLQILMIGQILATKGLKKESMKVYKKLKEGDLAGARKAVSWLVGRDTETLSESEVAKAAVETIAENTSDGVIAPLFFITIGGGPLGMAYKAVNTLDSMVGYRSNEFLYFGKASARLDDLFNFIPSRLAGLLMVLAAFLCGLDGKESMRIFRRDRNNHLSPNSAQTESAAAGALHIQLGGTHNYFGKPVVKPIIGDEKREVEMEDIKRANQMLYVSAILMLLIAMIFSFVTGVICLWIPFL